MTDAWYSPPQIAAQRRLRVGKVLAWISRGELEAINVAEDVMGRPRWRVSAESLAAFDRARSCRNRAALPSPARRRRPRSEAGVTEYF